MSSSDDPFLLHHHNLLYHVPQHSRREKLRFQTESSSLPNPMAHFTGGTGLLQIQPPQGRFSLTLSPAAALLPLGPFTGYAAVLNRSRFLDPARQLLEEVCEVAGGEPLAGDPPEVMSLDYEVGPDDQQWKKARLISMIDEVCRRYKIYYQQVQNVIASFEMVAGLRTAAPYVSLALNSMSKHFRCLKNMMANQLNLTNKDSGKEGFSRTEISGFGMCLQQDGSNLDSYRQPHAWRPQRGLPERAIAVLRAWLFEHFLHPYPTDVDKQMLAKQAGLTRNQVSNWFINARVRLWKPMVEEIHNLEMRQQQKTVVPNNKNQIAHNKHASKPSSSTATSSSTQPPQNSFIQRNQNPPSSRSLNNELDYIAHHIEEPYKYAYNDFSSQDVGRNTGSTVSLTLGLHQNSGVRLPEPLPLNVARRFGLEDCNDAYVVGAFEGQDRRFGKDIGGHLLHDFVG
ncbi:hypothetical protein KFK09_021626 [Dendrobium nobile]|uniref:Homeobox domain-containing protein n=1 Tax=Dendrobium nobile TaxID=94219 RepID=A0A8T3AWA1_DENNO|nr:hypothetical protein KFK09_021626 [Dendrobium nobile]